MYSVECDKRKYPVVKNKVLRLYLYVCDFFTSLFLPKNTAIQKGRISKILLRNPAALGDVLYTLRLIDAIKTANPQMEIGLLVGSWSLPLVSHCEDIAYIHTEDHWSLNRNRIGKLKKIIRWWHTRNVALKEIRDVGYDVAIDCYYYYPSGSFLLFQAHIPIRIGYDSHGGSSFYTKILPWKIKDIHNVEYQAKLIESLGIMISPLVNTVVNFEQTYEKNGLSSKRIKSGYIVVSVGTGAKIREWPETSWKILFDYLKKHEYKIIFVGAGQREQTLIDFLMKGCNKHDVISLCNKLSIPELAMIISRAKLFIGLESFAGHIAAMYKVPQISIMHGSTNQYHWQPFANPNCKVIRRHIDCSPCYFPSRCIHHNMCMEIEVGDIIAAIERLQGVISKCEGNDD